MIRPNHTQYGPSGIQRTQLASIFDDVRFGTVTLNVIDGAVATTPKPHIRFSGKPRSHLIAHTRDPTEKRQPSQAEAISDLLSVVSRLSGTWEVKVKVSNSIPFNWDYEEVRPLQSLTQN